MIGYVTETRLKDDLDLRKLEIFYWVAELKSFSQAAELLSLRQPTVSAHIQELEQLVKGALLYRIRGRVSLTPLGRLLFDRARNLLAFKREAVAAIEQFHGSPSGELWIGGSNNPGEYLLPQRLGAFVKKYPGIKPILRIGDSASIADDLLDGKVELGFVGVKNRDERFVFEKIWDDEMVLAVSRNHPWARRKFIHLSELRAQNFISRERGSGTMASFRRLVQKGGHSPERLLNVVMELGSTEAVKEAIMAECGLSILSRISIRHELADGSLVEVPIRGLKMKRDFYLVYHRGRPLHPNAQAFREFLKRE